MGCYRLSVLMENAVFVRFTALSLLTLVALTACGHSDSVTDAGENTLPKSDKPWVSAWGSTWEPSDNFALPPRETTVRNIVRVTASGDSIRLRFFNFDSDRSAVIGAASIGIRDGNQGAKLLEGSNRAVTFNGGEASAIIPPNTASYYSDPIAIKVRNQDDLAISLYVVGDDTPRQWGTAWNESYKLMNQSGDQSMDESGDRFILIDGNPAQMPTGFPVRCNGCRTYLLRDVEVQTNEASGAMVFLGSSSFHGANTSQNGYKRISDLLSVKMLEQIPAGLRQTVVNRAVSGDTLETAYRDRMDIDVWSTQGLASVVVWVTNDLEDRSAEQIIGDYQALINDAHSLGVKVFCPSWLPGAQNTQANLNGERAKLNDWILNSGECDGVADYNGAVAADNGLTYQPQYNSGDFVHSNDAGHAAWAEATPLSNWLLD